MNEGDDTPINFPASIAWLDVALLLSGLSIYDRLTIEPTLHQIYSKRSCKQKVEELVARGINKKEAQERTNIECTRHKKHAETDEFEYWLCPCKFFNQQVVTLLQAALIYKHHGVLPCSGGLLDQNVVTMEGINLILEFVQKQEDKERQEQERKAKAKQRR